MKNDEMLNELEERLKGLPDEDRDKLIELYKDLMEVANENRNYHPHFSEDTSTLKMDIEDHSYHNIGRSILASISLFFFNLIFVLGPGISVIGVYLALCTVSAAFVLSPLLAVLQIVIGGFTSYELFLSMILCGIGIALGAGMAKTGKGLYRILTKYVNWNIKLIKGE